LDLNIEISVVKAGVFLNHLFVNGFQISDLILLSR